MKGIEIKDLHFVGENDRGTTHEYENPRPGVQMLGYRKAGSINGNHYHEGKSSSKKPEVFILLNGNIELYAKNMETGEETTTTLFGPKQLEISPNVWHVITTITDIVFIELNSIAEHAADTKYEKWA